MVADLFRRGGWAGNVSRSLISTWVHPAGTNLPPGCWVDGLIGKLGLSLSSRNHPWLFFVSSPHSRARASCCPSDGHCKKIPCAKWKNRLLSLDSEWLHQRQICVHSMTPHYVPITVIATKSVRILTLVLSWKWHVPQVALWKVSGELMDS